MQVLALADKYVVGRVQGYRFYIQTILEWVDKDICHFFSLLFPFHVGPNTILWSSINSRPIMSGD